MDTSWLSTIAKALARFARSYPLRQIALAAALFVPTTIALHFLFAFTGGEETLNKLIGAWAQTVMGAGLAFLIALTWTYIRDRLAAKCRRSDRAQLKSEGAKARTDAYESWRTTIRGLNEDDKRILRNFVDQRRIRFEASDLDGGRSNILQRLQSLGLFEHYWPYSALFAPVFDLLLSEPGLVNSESPPILRIVPARTRR